VETGEEQEGGFRGWWEEVMGVWRKGNCVVCVVKQNNQP
jgi:hypothetical protein